MNQIHGPVAQPVEQWTFNPLVPSSNLGRPTINAKSHGKPWLFVFDVAVSAIVPSLIPD